MLKRLEEKEIIIEIDEPVKEKNIVEVPNSQSSQISISEYLMDEELNKKVKN